jgi:hypothetical protein
MLGVVWQHDLQRAGKALRSAASASLPCATPRASGSVPQARNLPSVSRARGIFVSIVGLDKRTA